MSGSEASSSKVTRKAIIKVKREWCKGCGICIELCPKDVLEFRDRHPVPVRIENCILCLDCELHCPDFAITVEQEGNE